MRRRSIITVGKDRAEIKIYTLRRPNGVPSYQYAWYDLGKRQTKTSAEIENAKFLFPAEDAFREFLEALPPGLTPNAQVGNESPDD